MSYKVQGQRPDPYTQHTESEYSRDAPTSFRRIPRSQTSSTHSLQGRHVQQLTPAEKLCHALETGRPIKECFPLFLALDTKVRDVAYQVLCEQFGSKTGDTKADGIDLFLENPTRLLATKSDARIIDYIIHLSMPPLQEHVEQLTPAQNLCHALEQRGTLKECFSFFQALDEKSRDVVYRLLCEQFGSKTGDTKKDGIDLFLEDHSRLLAITKDRRRIIDHILLVDTEAAAPQEYHPAAHPTRVRQAVHSSSFEDSVENTSQKFQEILQRKESETGINCGGMWTFLTNPDIPYKKSYGDFGIQDAFGVLWFNSNSPGDAKFLRSMQSTRFYEPAMRAIQRTPFKSLFAGSSPKILSNYFTAMLCHDWGSSTAAVYRLLKEVTKYCIIRDNTIPMDWDHYHSRNDALAFSAIQEFEAQRQQQKSRLPIRQQPPRQSRAPRSTTNEDRIQIFRETLREIPKRLDSALHQQMLARTQLIQPKPIDTEPQDRFLTEIQVANCTTFEMTRQVVGQGFRPLVLDMANAYTHGGGVTKGSPVQEETLCRQSNLYIALDQMNQRGCYPIPEHAGIFVPQVQFFRDDQYRFVQPFAADVFVSAAYDCNPRHKRGYDCPASEEDYVGGTAEKIRSMFRTAILNGNDSLVLSAFGCGAFENEPKFIAPLYLSILNEDEFRGRFRLVTFAVYDPPQATKRNYPVFQRVLNPSPTSSAPRRSTHPIATVDEPSVSRQFTGRQTSRHERESSDEDVDALPRPFTRRVRGHTHQEDRVDDLPPPFTKPARKPVHRQKDTEDDVPQPSFLSRWGTRIGGMFSSAPKKNPNDLLIAFYQGTGRDSEGRTFDDILKMDNRRLESVHSYIQWLFPLWEESGSNGNAPILKKSPHLVGQFRSDPACMKNLERAFTRMLNFYGLVLDEESMTISRKKGHRFHWLTVGDHNFKRITRIIGCLRNMGLKTHAQAFLDILDDIAQNEGSRIISRKNLQFWHGAVD